MLEYVQFFVVLKTVVFYDRSSCK